MPDVTDSPLQVDELPGLLTGWQKSGDGWCGQVEYQFPTHGYAWRCGLSTGSPSIGYGGLSPQKVRETSTPANGVPTITIDEWPSQQHQSRGPNDKSITPDRFTNYR